MTSAGVALISRVAFVAVLILVTAIARAVVGPSKTRGSYMVIGTVGGTAVGIAAASLISRWVKTDLSVILACAGVFVGWSVAWRFARRVPREAP